MSETCPPDRRSEDSGLTPPAIKARGGTGSGACVLEEKARAIAARRLLVDLGKVLEVTLYPLTGSLVVASFIEAGLLSWNGVPFLVRVRPSAPKSGIQGPRCGLTCERTFGRVSILQRTNRRTRRAAFILQTATGVDRLTFH